MELVNLYLSLFLSFFKIGLFGFGGGYAMLPLMQAEVVDANAWITVGEFTDMIAISQSTPGPVSLNMATYVGYSSVNLLGYGAVEAVVGAAICTLAVSLPSIILVTLFSYLFLKYKEHSFFIQLMATFRPVVIGLIASASILLMNDNNFVDFKSFLIFIGVMLASLLKCNRRLASSRKSLFASFVVVILSNPIVLIIIAGIIGYFIY